MGLGPACAGAEGVGGNVGVCHPGLLITEVALAFVMRFCAPCSESYLPSQSSPFVSTTALGQMTHEKSMYLKNLDRTCRQG